MIRWRNTEALLRALTPEVTDVFDIAFVAGGAATSIQHGYPVNDIDIYLRSPDTPLMYVVHRLDKLDILKLGRSTSSEFATSYKVQNSRGDAYVIQLIKPQRSGVMTTYGTPEEVIRCFDINVCMAYIKDRQAVSRYKGNCVEVLNSWNPLMTFDRLVKYNSKGFKVQSYEFMKVMDLIKSNGHTTEDALDYYRNPGDHYIIAQLGSYIIRGGRLIENPEGVVKPKPRKRRRGM